MNIVFLDHYTAPHCAFSIRSSPWGSRMSTAPYQHRLIPWSALLTAGPLPSSASPAACCSLTQTTEAFSRQRLGVYLRARGWRGALNLIKEHWCLQWGTLALMSWPLWPEDMETLCPSVPLRMRHTLAVYCNILLHIAIWPQTVGVLRRQPLSACCFLCCLLAVFRLSLFLSNSVLCIAVLFPYHPFFSSFFIFLTTQQLQTWRYPTPYHHDAWPPASALCSSPLRHDVTISSSTQTHILSPDCQGQHIPHCLSLCHLFVPITAASNH